MHAPAHWLQSYGEGSEQGSRTSTQYGVGSEQGSGTSSQANACLADQTLPREMFLVAPWRQETDLRTCEWASRSGRRDRERCRERRRDRERESDRVRQTDKWTPHWQAQVSMHGFGGIKTRMEGHQDKLTPHWRAQVSMHGFGGGGQVNASRRYSQRTRGAEHGVPGVLLRG